MIIGQGSFSKVYAVSNEHKKLEAVKVMLAENMTEKGLADFEREISIMSQLNGDEFVKLLGSKVSPSGDIQIFMELCEGGDLFSEIDRYHSGLPEKRVAHVMHRVMLALHKLHSKGLMHLDIKPENILLDSKGNAKLGDFGLTSWITEYPRVCCGSSSYVSPEMAAGLDYDQKTDLWSAGVVMYVALTGKMPAEPCVPADPIKGVSAECNDFMLSLMTSDPLLRPSAAQALEHEWLKKHFY